MDSGETFSALSGRTQSLGEEIANSISHGLGFLAALIAMPFLLLAASQNRNPAFFSGTIVFAATMLALYLGSTLYHAWPHTKTKSHLRLFDHCAIFLLIAGTYTPFALGPLRGTVGLTMLGFVWAIAIFGVILKTTVGPARAARLALALYLGMSWAALLFARPVLFAVPLSAIVWLLAGGIAYTGGVLFFVNERMRYSHFLWHLFVLAGSSCHFVAVLTCARNS